MLGLTVVVFFSFSRDRSRGSFVSRQWRYMELKEGEVFGLLFIQRPGRHRHPSLLVAFGMRLRKSVRSSGLEMPLCSRQRCRGWRV